MEADRIKAAFEKYKNSDIYKNYNRYRDLSDGKSADVFFNEVRARVNMEYMGVVDEEGYCKTYSVGDDGIFSGKEKIGLKGLVVGNGILQSITRLYAEYAISKPLIIPELSENELIRNFDFDDLLGKLMIIQSWAGKLLLKGVIEDNAFSFYPVTPRDYFRIPNEYNPKKTDGYVIYNLNGKDNKTMLCEIYEKDSIKYKAYKLTESKVREIPYPIDLTKNGMVPYELGFIDPNSIGWGVVEIENVFGKSDYNQDLLGLVRELVVGDTLTSQAFQKVANPLLQVPESVVQNDSDGSRRVMLDKRVVVLRREDQEIKQVSLETKTDEWQQQKESIKNDIYKQLGVNDLAFGIDLSGSIASGEAKRRSLERTLATVESKRAKCIKGISDIVSWGHIRLGKKSEEIEIKAQDILSLSITERVAIASQGVANDVLSCETAVELICLNEQEEEMNKIKADISYQTKLVALLTSLSSITREEALKTRVDEMTQEILADLGIDVEEE